MTFREIAKELEDAIKTTYEEGVTQADAEKLAAKCLYAQLLLSSELTKADLDSKMRKTGVKSLRAALYRETKSKADKITEGGIAAVIDSEPMVTNEQNALDEAEVNRDELERLNGIFANAHIYFRNLSKAQF